MSLGLALIAVFVIPVFFLMMDPRFLILLSVVVFSGIAIFLFSSNEMVRTGIGIFTLVAILGLSVYVELFVVNDRWQWGSRGARSVASQYIAEYIVETTNQQLNKLGEHDKTLYRSGPLIRSEVWKCYQSEIINVLPGYVFSREYFTILVPRRAWHSSVTQLYRVEKFRGSLYYNGGALSEPNRVSLLKTPVENRS